MVNIKDIKDAKTVMNRNKMKFLLSCEDFFPVLGGAEIYGSELVETLREKGHEVDVIYVGKKLEKASSGANQVKYKNKEPRAAYKNIPLFNRSWIRLYYADKKWEKELEKHIKESKPDMVLTQLMYAPSSVKIAKRHKIPVVVFLHTFDHFHPKYYLRQGEGKSDFLNLPASYKAQWPWIKKVLKAQKDALKNADLVIANSKFMSDILMKEYGVKSTVLHLVMDLERYRCKLGKSKTNGKKYITMISPTKQKGANIFIEMSARFPHEKFLAVGKTDVKKRLLERPNITYIPHAKDITEIYCKSKIVLCPSEWAEPYCRIPLEAGINRVPCISSAKGGLPESNKGGIVVHNAENMRKAIKRLLSNKKIYKSCAESQYKSVKRMTGDKKYEEFIKLVGGLNG